MKTIADQFIDEDIDDSPEDLANKYDYFGEYDGAYAKHVLEFFMFDDGSVLFREFSHDYNNQLDILAFRDVDECLKRFDFGDTSYDKKAREWLTDIISRK